MNAWTIRGNLIPTDDKATHLGIIRDTYSSGIASTIQQNITKGRKAAYHLLGAGLHGKYGLPPEVLRNMFQAYVVLPDGRHLETIEKEYRMLLIALLGLPNNVASVTPYLLLGLKQIEAVIHMKALCLYVALCRDVKSLEHQIVNRQLFMKSIDDRSWVGRIKLLLSKYGLPSAHDIFNNPLSRDAWKKMVDRWVTEYWLKFYQTQSCAYPSLKFNTEVCTLKDPHPLITMISNSPRDVARSSVKWRLLTGTYALQSTRKAFNQTNPDTTCLMCGKSSETLQHFLLVCDATEDIRNTYLGLLTETSEESTKQYLSELCETYKQSSSAANELCKPRLHICFGCRS